MQKSTGSRGGAGKTPAAEFDKQIKKLGLSNAAVAKGLGITPITAKKLMTGEKKFDIEVCLLVAKFLGTGVDFWIDLQKKAGLAEAKKDSKLQKQLKEIKKAVAVSPDKPKRGGKAAAKRGGKPAARGGRKAAAKRGGKPAAKRGGRRVKPVASTVSSSSESSPSIF